MIVPGTDLTALPIFSHLISSLTLIKDLIIPGFTKRRNWDAKQLSNLPKGAVNLESQARNHVTCLYRSHLSAKSYLLDYKIFVTNAHVLAVFKGVTTNGVAFHLWVWVGDWVRGPDSCHAYCLCWGSQLWSASEPLGTGYLFI